MVISCQHPDCQFGDCGLYMVCLCCAPIYAISYQLCSVIRSFVTNLWKRCFTKQMSISTTKMADALGRFTRNCHLNRAVWLTAVLILSCFVTGQSYILQPTEKLALCDSSLIAGTTEPQQNPKFRGFRHYESVDIGKGRGYVYGEP